VQCLMVADANCERRLRFGSSLRRADDGAIEHQAMFGSVYNIKLETKYAQDAHALG